MARNVDLQPGKDLNSDKEVAQGDWSSLSLADFRTAIKTEIITYVIFCSQSHIISFLKITGRHSCIII